MLLRALCSLTLSISGDGASTTSWATHSCASLSSLYIRKKFGFFFFYIQSKNPFLYFETISLSCRHRACLRVCPLLYYFLVAFPLDNGSSSIISLYGDEGLAAQILKPTDTQNISKETELTKGGTEKSSCCTRQLPIIFQ